MKSKIINGTFLLIVLITSYFSYKVGWMIGTSTQNDYEKNMNNAKCKSLKGEAENDGWGNITCYKNGKIIP